MKRFYHILSAGVAAFVAATAFGLGNDNPTGVAGVYNGNVASGCSYDPYTGNAKRTVDDIVVSGAVGSYPLAWRRYLNTRSYNSSAFGLAGHWSHSYDWAFYPNTGHTSFPDGRTINFPSTCAGVCGSDAAVSERIRNNGDGSYDLLLGDGGMVRFPAGWNHPAWIYDPFGNGTHLEYDGNGNLWHVTEPAGRYLEISWIQNPYEAGQVVSSVFAFPGNGGNATQSVTYSYAAQVGPFRNNCTGLTAANYSDGTHATYTYQPDNQRYMDQPAGAPLGYALIATADDPRYGGAMTKIRYTFAVSNMGSGVLDEEQSTYGDRVSKLTYPFSLPDNENGARTETRGDGPQRQFTYADGKLYSYTDFRGNWSNISYNASYYPLDATDANSHITEYDADPLIGAIRGVTYAKGTSDEAHEWFGYDDPNNPYYLAWKTNSYGGYGNDTPYTTHYQRDGLHRITEIDYVDSSSGGYETFSYNQFGQVLSHRLTNGATEYFEYDGRGLKTKWTDAAGGVTYYGYDANDHLSWSVDPRGAGATDANHMTHYWHNQRGQLTIVQYPPINGEPAGGAMVGYSYDDYGNKTLARDELSHDTTYTYDDYRRVLTTTNALNQTTTNSYWKWGASSSYVLTGANIYETTSPSGRKVDYDYDENLRRTLVGQAPGTADDASTTFGYDAVGNQLWMQDPRNYRTNYGYDARNRRTSETNPLNQTTSWQLDKMNHKTRETRPDGTYRTWFYDGKGRLWTATDFSGTQIQYNYNDVADRVYQITDAKGASYSFGFDNLNRKTSETYPPDAGGVQRQEQWHYDAAGNLDQYINPAGEVRHYSYDNRNRNDHSWWNRTNSPSAPGAADWGVAQEITKSYDAGSRVANITTNGGQTSLAYNYDDANRLIWEDQTVSGHETHRVQHDRDVDGNAENTSIPGWSVNWYGYNQRSQLVDIADASYNLWFHYTYDASGNLTKRQATKDGLNDSVNVPSYDELNRPLTWENTGTGDAVYARSHYQYDGSGREVATWRDEQVGQYGPLGERFDYNVNDQLIHARYNAEQVWSSPINERRKVDYDVDPLNRWAVWDSDNNNGNGLSATYFDSINLTGKAVTQNDATINFAWNAAPPAPGIPGENFSARWEGQVIPRYSETYTFYTQSDDGVRLWINGQLIIDNWTYHGLTENSGTITLQAQQRYDIKMEYFQGCCGAVAALLWSSPSQAKEVVPNGLLFAARPPNGLRATYYQNTTLSGTSLVRVDPNVNFNWGTGSPDSLIPVDWFSARWEGTVAPRYSGSYTFYTQADDGVRLWVNGQLLVDDWNYHPTQEHSGTITLSAGQRYSIRLEYVEATEGANVALLWSSPNQAKEVIPSSQLFQPTNSGEYRPAGTNQYVTANGQGPSYDARFNLTSYDGATFSYDAANHLVSASKGTNTGAFVYDGLGRCVKRTINGQSVVYAYDGWKPVFEHEWNGAWYAWNVYGTGEDEILYRYQSNVGYMRFHTDRHGNVTRLLNDGGYTLENYTYDAFGKPKIMDWTGSELTQSAYGNRFMFTGREWLAEFGIYDYRNRMYQPELGRFLQADPKGFDAGDFNLFRYCADDPVDHTDPSGLILASGPPAEIKQATDLLSASERIEQMEKEFSVGIEAHQVEMMAASRDGALDMAINKVTSQKYPDRKTAGKAGALLDLKMIERDLNAGKRLNELREYWGTIREEGPGDFSIGPPNPGTTPQSIDAGNAGRPAREYGYSSDMRPDGPNCIGYHYAHPRPADLIRQHASVDAIGSRMYEVCAAPRRGEPIGSTARVVYEAYDPATHSIEGPFY